MPDSTPNQSQRPAPEVAPEGQVSGVISGHEAVSPLLTRKMVRPLSQALGQGGAGLPVVEKTRHRYVFALDERRASLWSLLAPWLVWRRK